MDINKGRKWLSKKQQDEVIKLENKKKSRQDNQK